MTLSFLGSCINVAFLDVLLASDNIVVVAMAVRNLPPSQRRQGLLLGGVFAIVCRVLLTILASSLLTHAWVQFIGGLAILAIAIRLVRGDANSRVRGSAEAGVAAAACAIVTADLAMSLDNILAIAGASKGDIWVIVIGFGISMPLLLLGGARLAALMERAPILTYLGGACLARVAGDMMASDLGVQEMLHPSNSVKYLAQAILAVCVVLIAIFRTSGPTDCNASHKKKYLTVPKAVWHR